MDSSAGWHGWAWRRTRHAFGIHNANLHQAGLGVSLQSPHGQRDAYRDYFVGSLSRIEAEYKIK